MKNKLTDLNDHLFAALERLNDESQCADDLKTEIARSKAVANVAKEIVNCASLQLDAITLKAEYQGLKRGDMPALLIETNKDG